MPNKPNRPAGEIPHHSTIPSLPPSHPMSAVQTKPMPPGTGRQGHRRGRLCETKPISRGCPGKGAGCDGAAVRVRRAKQSQFVPDGQEWARSIAAERGQSCKTNPISPGQAGMDAGRQGPGGGPQRGTDRAKQSQEAAAGSRYSVVGWETAVQTKPIGRRSRWPGMRNKANS